MSDELKEILLKAIMHCDLYLDCMNEDEIYIDKICSYAANREEIVDLKKRIEEYLK